MACAATCVAAHAASSPPSSSLRPAREAVYVATMPLRGPKGPAQALMSAGYGVGLWDLQHFMVVVKPDPAQTQAFVFDFQPRDPEDAFAAFSVLSQRQIPGVILRRKLQRMPKRRCWFVGLSNGDAIDATNKFNERWSTELIIGKHDCRDYTNGLVEVLTGERRILDSLRSTYNN